MAQLDLSDIEQRVLGSLMEKQVTVPATYPMTLNGLRSACNQTSSREPVTDYSEAQIDECLRGLKNQNLIRFVWTSGSRAVKYHQTLTEQIEMTAAEQAVITVMLLRGPQSPGELKTRTQRLHEFDSQDDVLAVLRPLAERELVAELPLRPREHDRRWVHLLGGAPEVPAEPADPDAVLSQGPQARDEAVLTTYEQVATDYVTAYDNDLADKPFDRWLLGRVAERSIGPVADIGCGSGMLAAYLAEAGVGVTGFDVSPKMVAQAQLRHPDLEFEVADYRRMLRPRTASGWSAIVGWFAMTHLATSELTEMFAALRATLAPDGWLVFADHAGSNIRHLSDFLGHEVSLDIVEHDPAQVRAAVEAAGMDVLEWYVTGSDTGDRLYLVAQPR